jgi:N-acetylmuramoyl-L-alanine amidase
MGCPKKKTSGCAWFLIILLLLAVLFSLLALVVLQTSECSGGVCPEIAPSATEPTAETTAHSPTQTQPPTTLPPTEAPPQPESQLMRVVSPVSLLSAPEEDAEALGSLAIGEKIEILRLENGWYTVFPEGYLPEDCLRKPEDFLIVIDPGHQKKGNSEKEPIGPGASEKKAKVASGTQGVATGLPEYELTLEVSLKLRDALEAKGYRVEMIRTSHDINISNAQRAQIANEQHADVFIRIHANGDSNPLTNGIMTLCQTKSNPYNGHLYPFSNLLSTLILDEMVAAPGQSASSSGKRIP